MLLAKTKAVLKKSQLHQGGQSNVLLIFKSVEIIVMENDAQGRRKIHNPIYIPVLGLGELLNLSKKQLEMRII
jgi:hypothetical protein